MDEYVIINKTTLEKRIEELEKTGLVREHHAERYIVYKEILSQSTPLIPEIEKAWKASLDFNKVAGLDNGVNKKDYISNLKLDI